MRKGVQPEEAARRCPCVGMLCFLCALVAGLFGAKRVSAETPLTAMRSTPFAAPAVVLGVSNPYVIANAAEVPELRGFTLSRDIRKFALRFEKLARHGVDLNQRRVAQPEKLNLRFQTRFGGGVLQLCYTH